MENGGKTKVLDVLAENLEAALERGSPLKKGPSVKTIYNIKNRKHRPTLRSLEKLGKALGIEPWQLLCPAKDKLFITLCRAYNETDERGRETLLDNAEILLRRAGHGHEGRRSETGEAID